MARKIVLLSLVMVLISSCKQEKQNTVFLEIDNKSLKSEIIKYMNIAQTNNMNRSFIIRVFCLEINDSTTRYIISSEVDPQMIKKIPYHFVCNIGDRKVFFTMLAGISRYNWDKGNFFKLKDESYLDFLKNNFPIDYKLNIQKKGKNSQVLYEPEMYYLTYINEKLVKKEIRMGLPWY